MTIKEKKQETFTNQIQVDSALMKKSKQESLRVLRLATLLQGYSARELKYNQRKNEFYQLVGETGIHSFTPRYQINIKEIFSEFIEAELRLARERSIFYTSLKNSLIEKSIHYLKEFVTTENLSYNTVPEDFKIFVKEFLSEKECIADRLALNFLKSLQSPKLSKILSKVVGEQSSLIHWYTNECPKKIMVEPIKDENYKVVISVLPHHITGMSAYSSYNHGGIKWTGQGGTSCQDPIRFGDKYPILCLAATIKDETLAIAYLTKTENNDIMNPIYEARCLIRVFKLPNDKILFMSLKAYGDQTTTKILKSALDMEFGDIICNADTLRKSKNALSDRDKYVFKNKIKPAFFVKKGVCDFCDINGMRDGEICHICEGTKRDKDRDEKYRPYIDDRDFFFYSEKIDEIRYTLPRKIFKPEKEIRLNEKLISTLMIPTL